MIEPIPEHSRARAVRTVERKHPRRDLRIRNAAFHTREALAEIDFACLLAVVEPFDLEQVVAVLEGDFERVAETLLDSVADREAIDDHFNGMAHDSC